MTWQATSTVQRFTVDGVTSSFNVTDFPFFNPANVKVYQSDGATFRTDITNTATITVAADPSTGGTVSFGSPPATAAGTVLIVKLFMLVEQTGFNMEPNDSVPPETLDLTLDMGVMISAYLAEQLGRAPRFAEYLNLTAPLIVAAPIAGKVLAWDGNGNIVNSGNAGAIVSGTFTILNGQSSVAVAVSGMTGTSVFKWWPAPASVHGGGQPAANMLPFLYPATPPSAGSITMDCAAMAGQDLTYVYEVTI